RKHPLAYPKFHANPVVNGKPFLGDKASRVRFYADYKRRKHQLEMAASLVSLRESLEESEWAAFKEEVENQIKDFGIEDEKATHASCGDLREICTETERLHAYAHTQLQQALEEQAKGAKPSKLTSEILVKDQDITARNTLYVRHLKEVARLEHQLSQQPQK